MSKVNDLKEWAEGRIKKWTDSNTYPVSERDEWHGVENAIDTFRLARLVLDVLAELQKKPEPTEFTKKYRKYYTPLPADLAETLIDKVARQSSLIIQEACEIIDQQAAENKRKDDQIEYWQQVYKEATNIEIVDKSQSNEELKKQ